MEKIKILTLFSCVLMASSFLVDRARAAEPINLILNPGFESGLSSWTNNGSTYVVKKPASGIYSARSGIGKGGIVQNVMSRLTIGKTYTLMVTARLEALSVSAYSSIIIKNAAGAVLFESYLPILSTSFKKYSVTFTMPANAASAVVSSTKEAGAFSYVYVDDFSLKEVGVVPLPAPTPSPIPIPNPIPTPTPTTGYTPMGVGGGGAMSGVSISPYANLWFVGTDMGTLFRSTDFGASWTPVSHFQAVFSSDLTKAQSVGFSSDGVTVFFASGGSNPKRSIDGGVTFSSITMGLLAGEFIKYWTPDSSASSTIYAGTNKGLLVTNDKGLSWSRMTSVAEEAIGTFINQSSPTKRIYHSTKTKIYYSDNYGMSFTPYYAPTGINIRQFAGGADISGTTLSFGDNDGANACSWAYTYLNDWGQGSVDNTVNNCGYVWVSINGGAFVKKPQSVGDHLKMAENDSTTIYSTGSTKWLRGYGTKVFVSHDKGLSFDLKLHQYNFDVIPYAPWASSLLEYSAVALDVGWDDTGYESFAINQRNSKMIAGTGYYFIHSSVNAGENWLSPMTKLSGTGGLTKGQTWKSRGLEVTTVYKVKFHPTNSSLLYAAMADIGGMVSEDHGNSFRITRSQYNSIYDYAFDPNDDTIVYSAQGSLHDFPNEWHANAVSANGGIFKSLDRGRSWKRLTPIDTNYNRQFLSVGYDALHGVIYGGTQESGVVRSTDNGASWEYINAGMPSGVKIIPQIEVDPNNGNIYALLTGDAPTFSNQSVTGIYLLDIAKGATSWRLLRESVVYPSDAGAGSAVWYYPTAFAIDFRNPSVLWLVDYENHGNWLMSGAWKSTDGGGRWTRMKQITHPTDIKIDPIDNNKIYVASYYQLDGQWGSGGQLSSKDGGNTWTKNLTPTMQMNARGVTPDPVDTSKIFYSYFGGGILHGNNPLF